jgi:hypothetical protein
MVTMTIENEGIIRKIQKLFNLANNATGNEVQASAALAKAHELLMAHNLSLAVVQDTVVKGGVQNGTAVTEEARKPITIKRSAMYKWQRRMWGTLAHVNHCFHWVHDVKDGNHKHKSRWDDGYKTARWVKRHVILGRESNVIVVNLMGEYLCDTIERLCPYAPVDRLSRAAVSWREGVADRLTERLVDQQEQEELDTRPPCPESPGLKKKWMAQYATRALALKDVRKTEYEANYDALYGEGAYKKSQEACKVEAERIQQERIEFLQNESPSDKRKREADEERRRIRSNVEAERSYRRQERERLDDAARTDWRAYDKGKKVGDGISLATQISSQKFATAALEG